MALSRRIHARVFLLVAVASLGAASMLVPPEHAAAVPPAGSRILVVNQNGVRDLSTGQSLPLPGSSDIDVNPIDGRIALAALPAPAGSGAATLVIAGARGECPRTVAEGASASWAPDGIRLVTDTGSALSMLVPGAPGEGRHGEGDLGFVEGAAWFPSVFVDWLAYARPLLFDEGIGSVLAWADLRTHEQRTIDGGSGFSLAPAWSRDGRLAYAKDHGTPSESGIWVSDADGSTRRLVNGDLHDVISLAWTRDGTHLLAVDKPSGAASGSLYLVDVATGEKELLDGNALAAVDAPPVPLVRQGYALVADDGASYGLGASCSAGPGGARTIDVAGDPVRPGQWQLGADGGVRALGAARWSGDVRGLRLNQPVMAIVPTPSGNGYWLVAADGGVFTFGDAPFVGSLGGLRLNQPIVGGAAAPDGRGYWLVASDGGVFTFGSARFFGSTGGQRLNAPIVAMRSTSSGRGYWLAASDGGVFTFGDARFFGSTGGIRLNRPIVDLAPPPGGTGYWMLSADGGVFTFGDARFRGSSGGSFDGSMIGIVPELLF
jgi:hypothetical protein